MDKNKYKEIDNFRFARFYSRCIQQNSITFKAAHKHVTQKISNERILQRIDHGGEFYTNTGCTITYI